jgi:pilus assembly protein Flp/PilA
MLAKMTLLALKAKDLSRRVVGDRKGVTAVEYGVIAALIIVVCIVAITTVGTNLQAMFNSVGNSLTR